jgi:SAM-dependent methyltransferase
MSCARINPLDLQGVSDAGGGVGTFLPEPGSWDAMASDDPTLTAWRSGGISAGTALTRLLLRHRDVDRLREAVAGTPLDAELRRHELWAMQSLDLIERADRAAEGGLDGCRSLFDAAAARGGDEGMALYTLGDRGLLDAATEETIELLTRLGVVASDRRVLDIGCGNGRFEVALSPRVARITGVDLSPGMIGRAAERCRGLGNVELRVVDGDGGLPFADAAFDAIIAVDSFPYLFQAGGAALVARQVEETARVLADGGRLVVLNLSYRDDPDRDAADAALFAAHAGLRLVRAGQSDLKLWDGRTFHFLKERPSSGRSTAPQAYL